MNRVHLHAILQAVLVTFLWSTSWVLIKFGLKDIPALTFAGLRYFLAFLCLLPFAARKAQTLRTLPKQGWMQLFGLGILFYTVTQGAQFLSLFYLPAITTNLLLSFSAVLVAILGIMLLGERPNPVQWGGMALYVVGVLVYFYPATLPLQELIGLAVALTGVLANVLSSILGRHINRADHLDPVVVTVVSMGFGSVLLLAAGLFWQGFPQLSWPNWLVIAWLAVVNSAFAFTLWNITLKTLSAMESSIINNLMLLQIPILAYLFLGERMTQREGLGLVVAGIGILVVQVRKDKGTYSVSSDLNHQDTKTQRQMDEAL